MRQKLDRRVEMTQKLLKKSLIEMLKTENIEKISIRNLCQNADVNRSTFYKHYSSQYDLLKDIENDLFSDIEDMLAFIPATEEDSDRDLQFANVLTYLKDNIDLCKILMLYNIDPKFQEKLMILPSISFHTKKNPLSPATSQHSFTHTQLFVLDGAYCMVKRWIMGDCQEPPLEIAALIRKLSKKIYEES